MAERSPSKAEGTTTAGYIVTTWPRLSQTFVLNEILTLEERGQHLRIFSLKDPGGEPCMRRWRRCGRKPNAEQRTRAGLFAQRCLIDVLDPAGLSPESLAERLVEDLGRSDYP